MENKNIIIDLKRKVNKISIIHSHGQVVEMEAQQ